MDLAAFLRARLDEDERLATLAAEDARGMGLAYDQPVHWRNSDGNLYLDGGYGSGIAVGGYGGPIGDAVVDHVARHDPASVLADVAARRDIVTIELGRALDSGVPNANRSAICRLLSARYAEHPDYQPEWHPATV